MAEDGRLLYAAELSDKGFEEGAKKIQKHVEDMTDSVKKSGMTVDEFAKHMQGVVASFEKLTQAVDKNTKAQEQVAQAGKKAADAEKQGADKATEAIEKTDGAAKKLGGSLRDAGNDGAAGFDKLAKYAAGFFTLQKATEFAKKIFDVRSEIQGLQTSFETLVGNKPQADELFNNIREFAVSTPMQLKDLAGAAQTMMSFNIPVEQIMDNLKAIGDVSMGDAQKFQSLSLAFSQMSATGKLMGQDLLQMINAGFNPLATISEKTGKSIETLKDEMSKGAISADMVRQAFIDATSEGGKFNGMLEAQSKTLRGAYSNLQGAINDMLNEIGEKSEGVMTGAISVAETLVKNYDKVGQVLLGLITTYGTYKAAVIAVTLAETTATGQRMIAVRWTRLHAQAQAILNKTMLANPYVAAAAALGILVGSIIAARDGLNDAERAQRDYNAILDEAKKKQENYNNETQEAIRLAQDDSAATGDRESAMQTLIERYPKIIQKYIDEKGHLTDILNLKREIAAYDGQTNNLDNKTRADMYKEYVRIINKQKRGEALDEREKHLYQGAVGIYNKATPWYQPFSQNGAIDYFTAMQKQASRAYGRGITGARVNSMLEKMGEMKTDELKKLSKVLNDSSAKIQKGQAIYVKEIGDYLETSDLQSLTTKANGILDARNPKKKELTDKEKKAAEKAAKEKHQQEIKDAEAEEKIHEIGLRQQQEAARRDKELRMSTIEAEIQSMAEGTDKKLMQLDLDRDRELTAIEDYYENLRQKRIDEAKQLWDADPDNKGKNFFDSAQYKQASSNDLSLDELENKMARINAAWAVWQRSVASVRDEEKKASDEAINNNLRQYGSFIEKRQAIINTGNNKILELEKELEKATTDEARAGIEAKINTVKSGTKEELDALDQEIIDKSELWSKLFSDFSNRSSSAIRGLMKDILQLIDYMNGVEGVKLPDIFANDEKAMKSISAAMADPKMLEKFINNLKKQWTVFKNMVDKNNPFKKIADGFKNKDSESMSKGFDQIAQAVGEVKNIMSDLGVEMESTAGKAVSIIGDAASYAAQGAQIGGAWGAAAGAALGVVKGLVGSMGADYSSYNNLVDQYGKLIDVWDDLISKKEEYINMSYGAEAAKAGSEAISLVERETEAWRKLGKERLNAGASAGSHAIGSRMARNTTSEDWINIAKALGMTVSGAQNTIGTGRMTGLFDLTSEQLQRLKEEAPEFWAKMDSDVQKYLQSIIDGTDKISDLNDLVKEQLTSITFDSMYDSFVDMLSDMDASSKDFADNFEKYMFNAILSTQIGQKYKQRLQSWYDQMALANEDSVLSEDEIKNLRGEWDAIVADALRERNSIASATGYSSSSYNQEASSGGWQNMGQETADELNGRFTALQISGEKIAEGITSMLSLMASLTATSDEGGRTLSEIRNLMVTNNAHLEDILIVNKSMYKEFTIQLKKIANNS